MMRIEWLLTAVIIGLAVIVVGALAGCPTQEDQTTEEVVYHIFCKRVEPW